MSSFRNAMPRKTHREREQPSARKGKFGLLEKHKDYKLRADDFHRKEKTITALKEKALLRNPDEFYFAMLNSKTKNGKHVIEKKGKRYSNEEMKAIRTQDANYLKTVQSIEEKKVNKLKSDLHYLSAAGPVDPASDEDQQTTSAAPAAKRRHVVFVDDEQEAQKFSTAEYFQTHPSLATRNVNRPRLETLMQPPVQAVDLSTVKEAEKQVAKTYKELINRSDRKRKVDEMVDKAELHKKLMSKGKRSKVVQKDKFGEVIESKTVYKWKLQRKR